MEKLIKLVEAYKEVLGKEELDGLEVLLKDELSNDIKEALNIKEDINEDNLLELALEKINENKTKELKENNSKKIFVKEIDNKKFLVDMTKDLVIDYHTRNTMTYKEFESKFAKKSIDSKFKGEKQKLELNELKDLLLSVENDNRYSIYSGEVSYKIDDNIISEEIKIIIDTVNPLDSHIIKNITSNIYEPTKKETLDFNADGFSPFSLINGLTNSILFYANQLEVTNEVLTELGFIDLGSNDYINNTLMIGTALNKETNEPNRFIDFSKATKQGIKEKKVRISIL